MISDEKRALVKAEELLFTHGLNGQARIIKSIRHMLEHIDTPKMKLKIVADEAKRIQATKRERGGFLKRLFG